MISDLDNKKNGEIVKITDSYNGLRNAFISLHRSYEIRLTYDDFQDFESRILKEEVVDRELILFLVYFKLVASVDITDRLKFIIKSTAKYGTFEKESYVVKHSQAFRLPDRFDDSLFKGYNIKTVIYKKINALNIETINDTKCDCNIVHSCR